MKRLIKRIWNALRGRKAKTVQEASKYQTMGKIIQFPRMARK